MSKASAVEIGQVLECLRSLYATGYLNSAQRRTHEQTLFLVVGGSQVDAQVNDLAAALAQKDLRFDVNHLLGQRASTLRQPLAVASADTPIRDLQAALADNAARHAALLQQSQANPQMSKRLAKSKKTVNAQARQLFQRVNTEIVEPAEQAFAAAEYARAIPLYSQALTFKLYQAEERKLERDDQGIGHCLFRRTQCYIAEHDFEQALFDSCQLACKWNNPDDVRPAFLRSIALIRAGFYECAVDELTEIQTRMTGGQSAAPAPGKPCYSAAAEWDLYDTKAVKCSFSCKQINRLYSEARRFCWQPFRKNNHSTSSSSSRGTSSSNSFCLEGIPSDLFQCVALFLDATSVTRFACTCIKLHVMFRKHERRLWQHLAEPRALQNAHQHLLTEFDQRRTHLLFVLRKTYQTDDIARIRALLSEPESTRSWPTFCNAVYTPLVNKYTPKGQAAQNLDLPKILVQEHVRFMKRRLEGVSSAARECAYCHKIFWPFSGQSNLCPNNWYHGDVEFSRISGIVYRCCKQRESESHYCAHTYYLSTPIPSLYGCKQGSHCSVADESVRARPLPFRAQWLAKLKSYSTHCKHCAQCSSESEGGSSACVDDYLRTLNEIANSVRTRSRSGCKEWCPQKQKTTPDIFAADGFRRTTAQR